MVELFGECSYSDIIRHALTNTDLFQFIIIFCFVTLHVVIKRFRSLRICVINAVKHSKYFEYNLILKILGSLDKFSTLKSRY